jgi:hypothetical protein
MKVLIACEYSGAVRDAFIARGHDAMSCDLLPTDVPGPHYKGDVFDVIDDGWDLMIAHPPCTYLTVSGNRWMKPEYADRFPTRQQDRLDAIEFFMKLYEAPIAKVAVENPVGIMSKVFRKPDQYIHPYQFGDPHSKKTGLWLKGLKPLEHTELVEPEFYIGKDGRRDPMWHFESLGMSPLERMKHRSKTFPGIAKAMAEQWG